MVLSPYICCNGNFPQEEKPWSSFPSTQRKTSSPKHKIENPYSSRGLDKFYALLAELEEKRRRIYSQVDSKHVSFVRFAYSNDNDCIPIVVKSKDNQTETKIAKEKSKDNQTETEIAKEKKKKPSTNREAKHDLILHKWRRPRYYLPVAILLILLFLAMFGRSFAIPCISLCWYILPTLTGSDSKRPTKNNKKVYVRRFSENKIVIDGLSSPKNNNSGAAKDKSSVRKLRHLKSW